MDDINQQKETELANKRLLELLDASSDFIGQADINKNLTYLNPAFKKLVGYGQKGRTDIIDWHPTKDLQKLDEVIFPQTLKNGSWRGEVDLLDVEGNIIPCSLLELGHKNSKGEFETFSAIFRDISDLKQKEAELLKQTRISEHQSKLAAIGQLAAGVGHEINNPLAIAKGYIESSLNFLIAQEGFEQATLLNRLEKVNVAIDRISKITKGLRRFARNDSENAEYCAVDEIIYEAYGLVQEIYSNDGIHLTIKNLKDVDDTFVCVDKGKLQQVLMNILGNARDAVENSSIKDIQIDLKKQDGMVIIEVKDSGVGIPSLIAERIFDPFFTTKDVNKGTGLGLSFVREYIEEMKGKIEVSSIDGESTTFTIKLPEATKQTILKDEKVIQPCETHSVRPLNILVVEDEESLCEFYCELQESIGHEVETSHSGDQALAKLFSSPQKFDLIVSDMQMPVMGGLELAKEIKKNNTIKQPQFLLTTGGVDIDLETKDSELYGVVDGYLFKPFKASSLISAVNKLFE